MKKYLIIAVAILFGLGAATIASDLIIESKTQSFSETDNKIHFDGDVKVKLDNLNVVGDRADITTKGSKLDTATFYDKPYAYQVQNNKKREVKANILKLSLITKVVRAEGDTQTTVMDGKKPIAVITANSQEYDTKSNVMTAMGGVVIKYQEINTFSDKAVIRTDKKGDLKRIDLFGNAKINEKTNKAEADHFIYDLVNEELISEGHTMSHTEMDDGKALTIKGSRQQYSKKQNTFNCSGNVQVWYDDYYAKGPKMSVFPSKATNKFNEIYFTGRSFINQGEKTIYADKIKLQLKPKDFYAEGNAKTVIKNIQSQELEETK